MINERSRYRAWVNDILRREIYMADVISVDWADEYITYIHEDSCGNRMRQTAEFENIILMQCTGLRDKNGTLIFEGDVVRLGEWDSQEMRKTICEIEWLGSGFCAKFNEGKIYALDAFHADEANIISNIHDNPSLLKEVDEK